MAQPGPGRPSQSPAGSPLLTAIPRPNQPSSSRIHPRRMRHPRRDHTPHRPTPRPRHRPTERARHHQRTPRQPSRQPPLRHGQLANQTLNPQAQQASLDGEQHTPLSPIHQMQQLPVSRKRFRARTGARRSLRRTRGPADGGSAARRPILARHGRLQRPGRLSVRHTCLKSSKNGATNGRTAHRRGDGRSRPSRALRDRDRAGRPVDG